MGKDLVNELYKFINSDKSVTFESLKTASDSAYSGMAKENDDILREHEEFLNSSELFTKMPKTEEGKLPADPSTATPDQILTLAEKDKAEKPEAGIKTANSGVTETPEKGRLQKEMDKATPDVDKKSDFKVAAKVETAKAKEPEITGVENKGDKDLKKEQKTTEGKLPADPSTATPDQIQTLAEEKALVTVSDKTVADGIAKKYQGGRVVPDDAKKQFVIMVPQDTQESVIKEETTSEPTRSEVSAGGVPYTTDKSYDKLSTVSKSDPKDGSIKDAESNKAKYNADPQIGAKGASTGKQDAPSAEPSAKGGTADQNASKKRDDETQGVLQHNSDPKGEKTTAPGKPEVKDTNTVAGTKAAKADKLTPEAKKTLKDIQGRIKEDTEVTISSDGKTATVSLTPDGVNVSTGTSPEASTEIAPLEDVAPEVTPEEIAPEASEEVPSDEEFTEDEATDFAERVFVSAHLASLGEANLNDKQKAFIAETKKKKMSKKNQDKVAKKLKAMQDKKNKK